MNTDDLKAQGLTQEQIDFVMAEHGKVVNPLKSECDSFDRRIKFHVLDISAVIIIFFL